MRVLGIIPAREGSKGIPDKNVATCAGKPLIAWTIEAAKKADKLDRVIVSTDSKRYKEMLEYNYGKDLFPFMRPEKLARDKSTSADVVIHALDQLEAMGECYDIVVLLEPTSPLRTPQQINEAVEMLENATRARAMVSIVQDGNHHPIIAFEIAKNGQILPYGTLTGNHGQYPGHPRRQALRPAYFMSGDLYLSYVDTYREKKSFNHELTAGYLVESWQAPEVDEPCDLIICEALLKARMDGKI